MIWRMASWKVILRTWTKKSMALPARLRSGQTREIHKLRIVAIPSLVYLTGPAPVTVFDDEAGIGGQGKIAPLPFDQLDPPLLQERHERRQPGSADLLARPARAFKRGAAHSLFSNG